MNITESPPLLAVRLGTTAHISPLRMKAESLKKHYPTKDAATLEDWLVDLANARGARIVVRPGDPYIELTPPPVDVFSNEALVVSICQVQSLDHPQMLRLAAQLISAQAIDVRILRRIATRERAERVLAELSRNALRIDPTHTTWRALHDAFGEARPYRAPLLHWTRMAHPVPTAGLCDGKQWKLVA